MAAIATTLFSLDAIAASGQVFTWRRTEDGWLVASGERRCLLSQEGDAEKGVVFVRRADGSDVNADELAYWRHYLALDVDYQKILDELAMPAEVMEVGAGIRVLAQDWWDTAVSFVVSQNSNIVRIQRTMDALLDAGGGCVPGPGRLSALLGNEAFIEGLKLGYRRPYLEALAARAQAWHPTRIDRWDTSLEESMAELEESPGIGPKVASCICLFGLGYLEAVPRDTWIKRAEREHHVTWNSRWGGIQQQFVFAWMREKGRGK
jgi:N-glycosylase/DNA lyase